MSVKSPQWTQQARKFEKKRHDGKVQHWQQSNQRNVLQQVIEIVNWIGYEVREEVNTDQGGKGKHKVEEYKRVEHFFW